MFFVYGFTVKLFTAELAENAEIRFMLSVRKNFDSEKRLISVPAGLVSYYFLCALCELCGENKNDGLYKCLAYFCTELL
jgi:hypothetical protein